MQIFGNQVFVSGKGQVLPFQVIEILFRILTDKIQCNIVQGLFQILMIVLRVLLDSSVLSTNR